MEEGGLWRPVKRDNTSLASAAERLKVIRTTAVLTIPRKRICRGSLFSIFPPSYLGEV